MLHHHCAAPSRRAFNIVTALLVLMVFVEVRARASDMLRRSRVWPESLTLLSHYAALISGSLLHGLSCTA